MAVRRSVERQRDRESSFRAMQPQTQPSSPGLTGRSSTPRHIGSSTAVSGIPDAPLEAGHDSGDCHEHFPTRASAPSRRWGVRVLEEIPPSVNRGRREGQASADACGPPAKEMQAAGTTGAAETTRPSLRDGLHAYTQSPWCAGLVGHHGPRGALAPSRTGHQHRGVRTLRLHVRKLPFVRAPEDALRQIAAIAPRPACRDDRAQRPFRLRRDARIKA